MTSYGGGDDDGGGGDDDGLNWSCDVFWKQLNGLILVPFTRGSDKLNYQERIEVPRKIAVKLFLHNQ